MFVVDGPEFSIFFLESCERSLVPKQAMRRFCKDSNCTRFPFQAQLNLKMFISTIILIKILPNSKSHPVKRNLRRENNNLNCHRLFNKMRISLHSRSSKKLWRPKRGGICMWIIVALTLRSMPSKRSLDRIWPKSPPSPLAVLRQTILSVKCFLEPSVPVDRRAIRLRSASHLRQMKF